jgi:cytoskeletal protein RodZ
MSEEIKTKPALLVGQQLKARRQALRLSLAQVEADTKIRGKFLTALEAGDYSKLPNDVYSRGFVQHYASYLGQDGSKVAAAYAEERGGVEAGATKREQFSRPRHVVSTGPLIAAAVTAAVVLSVGAYILWQFSVLAAPPQLTVSSPSADVSVSDSVVSVSGRTTPGTDVMINDSPIFTDTDGGFSEKVALQDGVNSIRVTAKSKLGKSTSVTRNVLARLDTPDAAKVPAQPFDGVAVAVSVTQTAAVVVKVDGAEQFRGTFLAGKSRLFTGARDISVTTSNAGATWLGITNSVAAGKQLGPLGNVGEPRTDLDFSKDTAIK